MIEEALAFLAADLNQGLARKFTAPSDLAVLAPVVGNDGKSPKETENRLVLSLVSVEREPIAGNTAQRQRDIAGTRFSAAAPLNINLLVLASANFDSNAYIDGLRVLSATLAHFQAHPVYIRATHPALPSMLDRLTMEWKEASTQNLHNLWTVLGGRYLPSALYLSRMLIVEDSLTGPETVPITKISIGSTRT